MTKKRGVWDTQRQIDYQASLAPVAGRPPATWGVRETPVGGDSWEGFRVTVGQGVVVGLAWGMVVTIAAGALTVWQGWPWWVAPAVGLATWTVIMALHLTAGVSLRQSLLWTREELAGADLDGDGHVGRPEPTKLRLELVDPVKQASTWLSLPISHAKAKTFAAGVLATGNVTVARWTGRGGLLTRSEFEATRDELLRGGLLRWVGGPERRQLGVELTAPGRVVLQRLADSPIAEDE